MAIHTCEGQPKPRLWSQYIEDVNNPPEILPRNGVFIDREDFVAGLEPLLFRIAPRSISMDDWPSSPLQ